MRTLLIGTGYMAKEYAKVLIGLDIPFDVVGRGETNCKNFTTDFPGVNVIAGGLDQFSFKETYSHAIVASNVESLAANTILLLDKGIKNILLEKPGGTTAADIEKVAKRTKEKNANVLIAYNRRFYSSVIKAQEIVEQDGGVTSFNFEFTEWAHTIEPLAINADVKQNWFLANSLHVVDTAFFIGGKPTLWSAYHSGSMSWHSAASIFAGAGISEKGALFSYNANWQAPGRWVVEILTKKHRLLFKPMESLQIQVIGSVAVNPVEVDDALDKKYKPGLYQQTKAFFDGDTGRFCTIGEQSEMIANYYLTMSGYEK